VPYIDLGYKPKEIGRLRVELTGTAKPIGVIAPTSPYSNLDTGFCGLFGYRGAPNDFIAIANTSYSETKLPDTIASPYISVNEEFGIDTLKPVWSKGEFYIQPRVPSTEGAFWIWDYSGPSSIDG